MLSGDFEEQPDPPKFRVNDTFEGLIIQLKKNKQTVSFSYEKSLVTKQFLMYCKLFEKFTRKKCFCSQHNGA